MSVGCGGFGRVGKLKPATAQLCKMNDDLSVADSYLDDLVFHQHTAMVHDTAKRLVEKGLPITVANLKREEPGINERAVLDSIDALVAVHDLERRQLGAMSSWVLTDRRGVEKGWKDFGIAPHDPTKPHYESVVTVS